MAGVKDLKKRSIIRKMLRLEKWQKESNCRIAAEAGVSVNLVAEVRRQMIAQGACAPPARHNHPNWTGYKPGASARGGYVFDEEGKVIREAVWLKMQATRRKSERAAKDGSAAK